MSSLEVKVRPKIGFLFTGLKAYWPQFPEFVGIGNEMYEKYLARLREIGEVVEAPERFCDDSEKSEAAGRYFISQDIDILFVLPFGYTTGMEMVPCVRQMNVPVRLLCTHQDATYDYGTATNSEWLHHSGCCCMPEYSSTLKRLKIAHKVIVGPLEDEEFWDEIRTDSIGAAAAKEFRKLNFAVIGDTYTNMTDMPADDHRMLKATGKLFVRPEIEEFEVEYNKVTEEETQEMLKDFRERYDCDETVTDEDMYESAKIAVVYDKIIKRHDISGYGYYWWGQTPLYTMLRSQSNIAGSRLASMGRPGVTEGDVKTSMAMKIMDLIGAGGMFLEFNSIDYVHDFFLISHDGPVNFNVSEGRPQLQHLYVHHGKTGEGIGIDFNLKKGPATLLNFTQSDYDSDTFKLIYTVGEVIEGDTLHVGNPNGRFRTQKHVKEFFKDWLAEGPIHHSSLGIGDKSREIEAFAEAMGFMCVRV